MRGLTDGQKLCTYNEKPLATLIGSQRFRAFRPGSCNTRVNPLDLSTAACSPEQGRYNYGVSPLEVQGYIRRR